jgi:hypothetical protein
MKPPIFVAEFSVPDEFLAELKATAAGLMFKADVVRVTTVTTSRDVGTDVFVVAGYVSGNVLVRLRHKVGTLLPNAKLDARLAGVDGQAKAIQQLIAATVRGIGEAAPRVAGGMFMTESEAAAAAGFTSREVA